MGINGVCVCGLCLCDYGYGALASPSEHCNKPYVSINTGNF
jgi:hypothetical protein